MDTLAAWLTQIWDKREAEFDKAAEAAAEDCRNDGMPDTTGEEVKAYWQTLPDWGGWKERLARIAADRQILALHSGSAALCSWSQDGNDTHYRDDPCETLRLLALPYADQPGYREEWRP
jgi:hypothetical protein